MSEGLVAALAAAQAKFGPVKKTKTNPHFKSTYAGLDDVLAAVLPSLNAQGIAVVQVVEDGDLVTRLLKDGDTLESRIPLNLDCTPQQLGSQLTYMRRYGLSALVSVASEDDDDGNAVKDVKRAPRNVDPYSGEVNRATTPRRDYGRSPSPRQLGARMNSHSFNAEQKVQFVSAVVGEPRKLDDCTPDELERVAAELDRVDAGSIPMFTPAGCVLGDVAKDEEPF